MHFWLLTARLYGRVPVPRNTSLNWFMPALVNISVGSSSGTTLDDGTNVWPCFRTKKSMNCCRMSLAVNLLLICLMNPRSRSLRNHADGKRVTIALATISRHRANDPKHNAKHPNRKVDQAECKANQDAADHVADQQSYVKVQCFFPLVVHKLGLVFLDQPDDQGNQKAQQGSSQMTQHRHGTFVLRRCGECACRLRTGRLHGLGDWRIRIACHACFSLEG